MKQMCFVCQNVDCKSRGSERIMKELNERVADRGLMSRVEVRPYLCFGACQQGPNIVLYPEKSWYAGVKPEDLDEIVRHLEGSPHVERLDTVESSLKQMVYELLDAGAF